MIILFGLAGSGKGTQGKILSEIFGWRWLSVGEAIRQTGGYEEIINNGGLIPDADVIKLMDKQIKKAEAEGFDVILDGYPRDKEQAEYIMNTMPDKIDGAIILEVPKEELYERLALRGRDDDKERSSIDRRFAIFEHNQRRDAHHTVARCQFRRVVHIELDHLEGVVFIGELLYNRRKHFARAAPVSVKINQHGPFIIQNLLLECIVVHFHNSHIIFLLCCFHL